MVLTMHDARTSLSKEVAENVRAFFGPKVYETMIPRNVRVAEAPSHGKPILLYDYDCPGSQAYIKLATEIIERERRNCGRLDQRLPKDRNEGPDGRTHCRRAARPRPRFADRRDGAEARRRSCRRGEQRMVSIERSAPEPAQSAQGFPRGRAGRAGRVDPLRRACVQPIIVRPERRRAATRSSPASAAGARRRGPACTPCRSSCASSPTRRVARDRHHRERAARRPQRHRGGDRLSRADRAVRLHARSSSPRSSARAAAMSPTRCACCSCPPACRPWCRTAG